MSEGVHYCERPGQGSVHLDVSPCPALPVPNMVPAAASRCYRWVQVFLRRCSAFRFEHRLSCDLVAVLEAVGVVSTGAVHSPRKCFLADRLGKGPWPEEDLAAARLEYRRLTANEMNALRARARARTREADSKAFVKSIACRPGDFGADQLAVILDPPGATVGMHTRAAVEQLALRQPNTVDVKEECAALQLASRLDFRERNKAEAVAVASLEQRALELAACRFLGAAPAGQERAMGFRDVVAGPGLRAVELWPVAKGIVEQALPRFSLAIPLPPQS